MEVSSTITIHPRQPASSTTDAVNPLPPLLQTPVGLALLELQGTINLPEAAAAAADGDGDDDDEGGVSDGRAKAAATVVSIGRLAFPDWDPVGAPDSTAWMRRVHLYVGPHQRLTGEVKKLPRPLAIVRRRATAATAASGHDGDAGDTGDLEVAEIVHYKLLFSQRPEPMTESLF